MALTKIGSIGINTGIKFAGVTTITTLNSATDTLTIGGPVSIAGTLTYEDVTNVDSVGLITARDGIVVGSGITLSKDGDGFFTGIVTATTFSGAFSGDGSALTGVANTDVIFTDKITLPDSSAGSINVGLGSDLEIYHDGGVTNDSYISNDTGDFFIINTGASSDDIFIKAKDDISIRVQSNEQAIECIGNGAVELYYDDSKKLATSASGVTVTGTVAATSYTGDGSALTGIAVGVSTAVATGITGITTVLDLSKNDHKITVSGITTVDVRGGTEGDSHSLRIINSGITTVGFSTYFLFPSGSAPIIPTTDGTLSMISFTVHRQGAVGLATQLFAGASVNFS